MKEGFQQDNNFESVPEISPEDLKEMLDQIPALREMLEERKTELTILENSESKDQERIEELKIEIEELELEIEGREEAGL